MYIHITILAPHVASRHVVTSLCLEEPARVEGGETSSSSTILVVHPKPGHGQWGEPPLRGSALWRPSAGTRAVCDATRAPLPPFLLGIGQGYLQRVPKGVTALLRVHGSVGLHTPGPAPRPDQVGPGGGRGPRPHPPGVCSRRLVSHAGCGVRGTRPGPLWVPFQGTYSCPSRHGGVTSWVPPTQPPSPVFQPGHWLRRGAASVFR